MLLLIAMFITTESKPGHFSKVLAHVLDLQCECYIQMEWRRGLSISLSPPMRWDSS